MPYNASYRYGYVIELLYENPQSYFKQSFLDENKIKGVKYKNENYNPLDSNSEEYIYDNTLPREIIHIVNNKEQYDNTFKKDIKADFDKSIIIVYLACISGYMAKIDDVTLKDKKLDIKYLALNSKNPTPNGQISIFVIDKIEFETINFSCSGVIQEFNISWSCTYR